MWFFETPPVFHWFFANVNACSPLTGIIWVFGHVGRDLLRNHPRPATYCALRTVKGRQKSRMRTTYQKTVWDSGFFAHALFLPQNRKVLGFSGSVNGTTKNPGFLDFGFCQCKWALILHFALVWKHSESREVCINAYHTFSSCSNWASCKYDHDPILLNAKQMTAYTCTCRKGMRNNLTLLIWL